MLKMQLDSLEGLSEEVAGLYSKQDNGKFVLNVQGHEKPEDTDRIPRSRLNQEIEKRKQSEETLKEVADSLIEDIPEEKRSIIPELPPSQKIKWLREALKMGFFEEKSQDSIDSKRPSDKKPKDLDSLSPQQKMAQGYKKK